MTDLTDFAPTAGDGPALLTVPQLMELDLDGPTLEILLAALTVGVYDDVAGIEPETE